jgi:SAM-dependent methyltransferase
MHGNGKLRKRLPSSALRTSLIRLVACCVGSIVGIFLIVHNSQSAYRSNGTALGVASVTAAEHLITLGQEDGGTLSIDRTRFHKTLSSMSEVLDRMISLKVGSKKLREKVHEASWVRGKVVRKQLVDPNAQVGDYTSKNNLQKSQKNARTGIRSRIGEDDERQGSGIQAGPGGMEQKVAPSLLGLKTKKLGEMTAGQAEVNMMRSTARNLVPQLLDLEGALSALPGDFYIEHSGTEISSLLLQARLAIARAVEHVEKVSDMAANEQLKNVPQQLHHDSSRGELKVQLGAAGDSALVGWLNIDIVGGRAIRTKSGPQPVELAMSIASTKLPMKDSSCSCIYAAHTLEHIRYPEDASFVLGEIFRVLRPGGVFRLVVPDARVWLENYVKSDFKVSPVEDKAAFWSAARKNWPAWQWIPDDPYTGTRLPIALRYLGGMETEQEMNNPHKTGYDFETMKAALLRAGFTSGNVIQSTYMNSKHKDLQIDDISEAAMHYFEGKDGKKEYFSLFMEATKVQ